MVHDRPPQPARVAPQPDRVRPTAPPDLVESLRSAQRAGGWRGLGFNVDDCQKTYEELRAKGVEFVQAPLARPYGSEAVCRDDSGNWIVLIETVDPTMPAATATRS
ncbi:hypothetical protein GCM10025867_05110 [Frondihabitans sucicola]|uniref:VOC domain-containing protein n=1 Tax=Frondihabitans sucicola TaxID=1268041 RepID=A0ABM8GIQ6_9MICO|nr:VOC family protein [Frondihabitans sucicola]BDZ48270.1 hypothetical protein GCM10025867_05110 [Frondihabitans sucicola]